MPSKGTTNQRGYGTQHQKRREQAKQDVLAGNARCWRCALRIHPHEPFDLGHDDHDRSQYRGPEHQACNRATAGRQNRRSEPPPALRFFDAAPPS